VAFPSTWIHEGGSGKSGAESGQGGGGGGEVAKARGAEDRVPGIALMRLKMTNKSSQVTLAAPHTLDPAKDDEYARNVAQTSRVCTLHPKFLTPDA
jgi:hypothetical protein